MPHAADTAPATEPSATATPGRTTCCVVGGGPAGAILAYLLARAGIDVVLLERHAGFDRDFRGDTVHPSVLELLDQLGLTERLLEIPHAKIRSVELHTPAGTLRVATFARLRTRHPYIAMIPQASFLELVTGEAARFPAFRLRMGARVQELIEEDGRVRGVRIRTREGTEELRADLTVAADGRFSTVRKVAGMQPITTSPPIDVLWFRLPRAPGDPHESGAGFLQSDSALILLDRGEEWQIALVVPKGSFASIREAGIQALRERIARAVPALADRVDELRDWDRFSLLSVESDRLRRWHRDGLLLIGDAAHVMSPAGGVGINYAIQDAVEAANVLVPHLRAGDVREEHLAEVQRRRELPTRVIQAVQATVVRRVIAGALRPDRPFRVPWALRILSRVPLLRDLPARLIAFGVRRVRVEETAQP